jgi:recombinational DNA repair protein (RecF pathway)
MTDRDAKVQEVEISIEEDLELMGLTGVEDKLQVCSACASIVGELLLTRSHSDSLSLSVSHCSCWTGECSHYVGKASARRYQSVDVDW